MAQLAIRQGIACVVISFEGQWPMAMGFLADLPLDINLEAHLPPPVEVPGGRFSCALETLVMPGHCQFWKGIN